jgi:hypothetical protein
MGNRGREVAAVVVAGWVLAATSAGLRAQDPLSAAKDLYASAAYEEALTTLTGLAGDGPIAPTLARQVDQYRAFCLFALGRTGEAESMVESLIRREPLAGPEGADWSPRLEAMFSNVRKRLLPSLIRDRFRAAKTAIDQKNMAEAEPRLLEARRLIADAEKIGVKDDGLSDLSVLVEGFLALAATSTQRLAAGKPAVAAEAVPAAEPARATVAPTPTSDARGVRGAPRLYSINDEGVIAPVALSQRIPPLTAELSRLAKAAQTSAVVDLVVDENGDVVEATLQRATNASFGTLVVGAARRWKYRPALKDGVPVRYLKTLVVVP